MVDREASERTNGVGGRPERSGPVVLAGRLGPAGARVGRRVERAERDARVRLAHDVAGARARALRRSRAVAAAGANARVLVRSSSARRHLRLSAGRLRLMLLSRRRGSRRRAAIGGGERERRRRRRDRERQRRSVSRAAAAGRRRTAEHCRQTGGGGGTRSSSTRAQQALGAAHAHAVRALQAHRVAEPDAARRTPQLTLDALTHQADAMALMRAAFTFTFTLRVRPEHTHTCRCTIGSVLHACHSHSELGNVFTNCSSRARADYRKSRLIRNNCKRMITGALGHSLIISIAQPASGSLRETIRAEGSARVVCNAAICV